MLSTNDLPNLTGLYDSQTDAGNQVLKCNAPQAFVYGDNLCTLNDGVYSCGANATIATAKKA